MCTADSATSPPRVHGVVSRLLDQLQGGCQLVARAAEVIVGLLPVMTASGWRRALPLAPVAVRQRTGYVLDALGGHRFAKLVQAS